jgi:N-acetyl sugar amidotransferase
MRFCRRCLYPENHPLGLGFDPEGICTGCRVHEEKDRLDWVSREARLQKILEGYRGRAKGRHDCVVPISGGRDSFFIVHLVRKVYGLNPLLVVYNRHYNSRAGTYNIARLRTILGCDIHTLTLAPAVVRRLMLATLAERGSFHWHALAGHTVYPVQVAVRTGIPLIIWGAHQGLEQVGMFSHLDEVEMTRRYRREHDLMSLEAEDLSGKYDLREEDLVPLYYPNDAALRRSGTRGIYLGNYIRWDTKAQHEKMVDLYDYYVGPLQRTFDSYNEVDDLHYMGLHDEIKFRKFGYTKVTDHACREIRYGRLTREEGVRLVKRYAAESPRYMEDAAAFLELKLDEIFAHVDVHRDPRAWVRRTCGWASRNRVDNEAPDAALATESCNFRSHRPIDLDGDAMRPQLLTRGYARE